MPTFQQAIDADPSKFMTYGATLLQTAAEVGSLQVKYAQQVVDLGTSWQGDDYQGLVGWAGQVATFTGQVDAVLAMAAATLESMGATMMANVMTLKATKQAAEGVGYKVLPTPMVILGPSQWSQVSSAGPGAPAVLAAYQAGAIAFTTALMAQYAAIVAQDLACNAAIRAAIAL
ncbi:hypothetical protein [Glycomyces buryatensis]|uniref:Uncharacterized protein n=1 Tax=Glycomyces buryatensis TaxID=2570927 RepID=A0A4S8QEY3_9ACTN|nr:hypothetical protein [Glycomyces buryatensis]THV42968.1 hypothetical protein FAB82_03170 [Glycomyces buryatensis]